MKKILIVEDDITISEVEKGYLEIAGFEVDVADNGTLGVKMALNQDYDLILLDVMLPDYDGFSITKDIRQEKDVPIILVTAKNDELHKLKGLSLGIDDYVTKPFSPNELIARVKAHLSRYEMLKVSADLPQTDEIISIRGLMINKTNRQVYVNGNEVEFTSKEYDLLILLISTPNKVFSKSEIFEKVWELNSDNDLPTITVHIRKLREKIEDIPSDPQYIQTVWGVGYKFKK